MGKITYKHFAYPSPKRVQVLNPKGGKLSLVAFGTFAADVDIKTAVLQYGASKTIKSTKIHMKHPHWVVVFADDNLTENNRPFTLKFTDANDKNYSGTPFDVKNPIRIMQTYITVPTTGEVVPPTFAAWGTTESANALTGKLTDALNNTIDGVTLSAAGDTLWLVQFQDVPGGVYTLTVTAGAESTNVSPVVVVVGVETESS
jgi:hypothetical protein